MARSLAGLKTTILDQADMASSSFIDSSQLTYWINAELSELHDLLVAAFEDYYIARHDIDLDGSDSYDLPEDFFKLLKCYFLDGGTRYRLRKFTMDDLVGETEIQSANEYMKYRIMGTKIYLDGTPAASGSLSLYYAPQVTQLSADTDRVDIAVPIGWEDFVVCGAVARCLAKEESDPGFFLQRKAQIRAHIMEMAEDRDAGESHVMADTYRRFVEDGDA